MKVGWILIGNEMSASARIMGIQVHNWMVNSGIDSTILHKPDISTSELNIDESEVAQILKSKFDIAILQKVCFGITAKLVDRLHEENVKVIYVVDDLIVSECLPIAGRADLVVIGSKFLQSLFPSYIQEKSIVMSDAYETPADMYKKDYAMDCQLRATWFGTSGVNFDQAEELRPILEDMRYEYTTITNNPLATKQWSLSTIWQEIMNSDVIVMPRIGVLSDYAKCKGNNRLTQAMVLGLPIIASPIPAYLPIIRNGVNGFIAYNNDKMDWITYLKMLTSEPLRKRIGVEARRTVLDKFNIETIGNMWMAALRRALRNET